MEITRLNEAKYEVTEKRKATTSTRVESERLKSLLAKQLKNKEKI
jgi:hypothetical protein